MRSLISWRYIVCLLCFSAGCAKDLDKASEVKDLRVLGIRATPPEVLDSPLPGSIRFEALVVDPRGNVVNTTWRFCPVPSDRACSDYEENKNESYDNMSGDAFGAPTISNACNATLLPYVGPLLSFGASVDGITNNRNYLNRYRTEVTGDALELVTDTPNGLASLDVSFTAGLANDLRTCDPTAVATTVDTQTLPTQISDLHLFYFLSNPIESLVGSWPTAILTATSGPDSVIAQKRINVVYRNPGAAQNLLGVFTPGLQSPLRICADASIDPGCLVVRERVQNTNPVFSDVRYAEGESANAEFTSLRIGNQSNGLTLEPIRVRRGKAVRILPEFIQGNFEEPSEACFVAGYCYETLAADLNTGTVNIIERVESISVSWFATQGEFGDELTWRKFTKTLDTTYTAPDEVPTDTDGWVDLWLVARDQRGGLQWQAMRVEILP